MARSSSAFDRLETALHRHYGDAALLRNGVPVTVVISHNVQLVGDQGSFGDVVSTARFLPDVETFGEDPLQVLEYDGGPVVSAWVLDRPLDGKGNTVEWVLREIP